MNYRRGADPRNDLTTLLRDWSAGDDAAGERLMHRVYGELRAMAAGRMRRERGDHTLQPTALVHEVFLRLIDQRRIDWRSRAQFFDLAGRMMRRVLVDHARRRARLKRGGNAVTVALSDADASTAGRPEAFEDVLALDEALHRLAERDRRKARIVELHFFAGLSVAETAEIVGCSKATVSRDWRFAKAWIGRELGRESGKSEQCEEPRREA
jgi:RNA polymerase sigma factor (TIGR02999 family)